MAAKVKMAAEKNNSRLLLQHTCKLGKMDGFGLLIQLFDHLTTNFTHLTSIKGHVSRKRAAIISKT